MERQTLGVVALTVAVLVLGAYFAFGLKGNGAGPFRSRPAGSARFSSSISNAKQVALGLLIYASDYDDRLPPDMGNPASVEKVVDPYLRNATVWRSANPRGSRFLPNENLSLVPGTEIVDPAGDPMLFESKEWTDGRRIIGYADGHVKAVTGFDPKTDLKVELTQKGKDIVAKSKSASTLPAQTGPPSKPLGMPGN
jgi:prepilin-type processing-associated H-X9-DG protein